MHFDLVDVRLLVAIASTGSLSKAAATFPVAVSAASTRLRQFEERCQVTLFARNANGMTPTPAGRLVLEACQRILNEAQRLRDNLQELSGQRRVVLRLCEQHLPAGGAGPLSGRLSGSGSAADRRQQPLDPA